MRMHILSGGRLRLRKTMYDANAARGETFDVPVSCVLFRHQQGNVLFDTGCHPNVAENAEAHWGGLAKVMTTIMRRGDNVITALGEAGLACDDIDVVVCSAFACRPLRFVHVFQKRASFVIHGRECPAARVPTPQSQAIQRPNGNSRRRST